MNKGKNNGITLIALIVTVIVLIILAAVTINMLLGQNGIITKTQEARIYSEIAKVEDHLKFLVLENEIDKYTSEDDSDETAIEQMAKLKNGDGEYYIIVAKSTDGSVYGIVNVNGIDQGLASNHGNYLSQYTGPTTPVSIASSGDLKEVFIIDNNLKVYYIDKSGTMYPKTLPIPTIDLNILAYYTVTYYSNYNGGSWGGGLQPIYSETVLSTEPYRIKRLDEIGTIPPDVMMVEWFSEPFWNGEYYGENAFYNLEGDLNLYACFTF